VCTNQGLFALRATIYLSLLGPQGLRETANLCLQKSCYAAEQLCKNDRFELAFDAPTLKEFVIRDRQGRVDELLGNALRAGFLAGVPLGQWFAELKDCFLVAVTERRTKAEIDALVRTLSKSESRAPTSVST
jgi:glycine dehydrogenase subunit 1